ncbi:MAG: hypothetical protein ACAI44_30330 [Candidatus Sericytochromatia bacterium]
MKRACLILSLLMLIGNSGCGLTGYGPAAPADGYLSLAGAQITPRSKGGTLNITPRSKGGTLNGAVIWPAEVAALSSRRFLLKIFAGDSLVAEGSTDAQGRFTLADLPPELELRVEAHVSGRPFVILRSLIKTPAAIAGQTEPNQEISMLTTAAAAVMADARTSHSQLEQLSPGRLLEQDTRPLLQPLSKVMTPYLDWSLSAPLESLSPVRASIAETRRTLEQALTAQGS